MVVLFPFCVLVVLFGEGPLVCKLQLGVVIDGAGGSCVISPGGPGGPGCSS